MCAFNGAKNFYPRPPGGGRLLCPIDSSGGFANFYPRPPGGGRPLAIELFTHGSLFLSTPSGWRATIMQKLCDKMGMEFLSTPSGWRATACSALCVTTLVDFYPRPPGGGRLPCCASKQQPSNFYPRPPGGGRLPVVTPDADSIRISIHALRVEDDCTRLLTRWQKNKFLSTPSGWRATPRHHAP